MLARAVRGLTDSRADNVSRAHYRGLLQQMASEDRAIADLGGRVLAAWQRREGNTTEQEPLPEKRRQRLSRAMSYALRHDRELACEADQDGGDAETRCDAAGWCQVDILAEHLKAGGTPARPGELLSVASSPGEPRFEVEGLRIRALYGHSWPVDITRRQDVRRDGPLYHATNIESLQQILGAGLGLLSMTRQYVHLAEDPSRAIASARRRGKPILLSANPALIPDLALAAPGTWLSERVTASALAVVPLLEQWSWQASHL